MVDSLEMRQHRHAGKRLSNTIACVYNYGLKEMGIIFVMLLILVIIVAKFLRPLFPVFW